MTFFLNLILLPRDLLFLSVDCFLISMDMLVYRPIRHAKDQPCPFCKRMDVGYRPRPMPPGLRKYRNRWLIDWMQPCLKKSLTPPPPARRMCMQDGSFVRYSRGIYLVTLILFLFWFLLVQIILH
ncbi:MAG: hypothetical protein ACO3N7_04255 [Kiritimatiellia bacterium]